MSAEISLTMRRGAFVLDAAFHFAAPGVTALFGASGAGKTMIIHAMAGLIQPQQGRIVIDGETLLDTRRNICVAAQKRRIGVVFQDARLFPHMTVKSNLLYGWHRARPKCGTGEIDTVIAMLGLENLLTRVPRHLSGGERSRVALGRALLMRPRALLLDEPLAALDAPRKAEILPYLERLRDETKIPILYVSHSLDEVARLADRMIVLSDGKVTAEGSIFDITTRLDLLMGHNLLSGAILEARIVAHDDAYALTELNLAGERLTIPRLARALGEKVRIRIDAQDVTLSLVRPESISANNVVPATVTDVRLSEGAHADVQLAIGDARLLARVTRKSVERLKLSTGTAVFAIVKSVTVGGRDAP
ncbi:MAG: molybdenum ABC transporter ATP-binding protein [Proteobacteria bacterium]|nr:molybdenum ABC transporter ATP-binding protein [Pseudomonadota bacterium]